jgi:hypothetical protein
VSLTTDPDDPRLGHGADDGPGPQNEAYLALSRAERAKGFTRPLRLSYRHAGIPGPQNPLRDLTDGERERYAGAGYVKYEEYPPANGSGAIGRFWMQADLDAVGNGCGTVTTMGRALAETYSRAPGFYGATYCCGCMRHLRVGRDGEFTWIEPDGSEAGNRVGT